MSEASDYREKRANERIATLTAELREAKQECERLKAPVSDVKRKAWFDDFRPIVNAIGEMSVQEAMDAIERDLK